MNIQHPLLLPVRLMVDLVVPLSSNVGVIYFLHGLLKRLTHERRLFGYAACYAHGELLEEK